MNQTSWEIKKSLRTGKPYKFNGLNIYPLTVEKIDMFYSCESVLTLRMSSLPAIYAMKTYAQAIFAISMDDGYSQYKDCWNKFLLLLIGSLRINPNEIMDKIKHIGNKDNSHDLIALEITQSQEDGEKTVRLNPSEISLLREVIAQLNGAEIPDEADNLELIEADAVIRNQSAEDLEFSMDDLLATVACEQRIRLSELNDWTIWEFNLIRDAIERKSRYEICTSAEMGGMVKFEKGNPYPSMWFNKKRENLGVISAESFTSRVGNVVQMTDELPSGANKNLF